MEQPLLDIYSEVRECDYKGEHYSVRDNGAIMRHPKKQIRSNDNQWTFGKKNPMNGYMMFGNVRVHIVVANAFHGLHSFPEYVVDHIDTNRCNNRPENLRWLTRLENILNNPATLKRIIYHCGSMEAFLADPSILRDKVGQNPDFDWMRSVSPEEARNALNNILEWAKNEEVKDGGGRGIGEWIFQPKEEKPKKPDYASLSPRATRDGTWKTPTEFPCCPTDEHSQLVDYISNLGVGKVFSRNQYGEAFVKAFELVDEGNMIIVETVIPNNFHFRMAGCVSMVTYKNNLFVHSSFRTYKYISTADCKYQELLYIYHKSRAERQREWERYREKMGGFLLGAKIDERDLGINLNGSDNQG